MKLKRFFALLCAVSVVCVCLAGCSAGEEEAPSETSEVVNE